MPARACVGAGHGGRGLPLAGLWRSTFPKTGFLKSCGGLWREPGKTYLHRGRVKGRFPRISVLPNLPRSKNFEKFSNLVPLAHCGKCSVPLVQHGGWDSRAPGTARGWDSPANPARTSGTIQGHRGASSTQPRVHSERTLHGRKAPWKTQDETLLPTPPHGQGKGASFWWHGHHPHASAGEFSCN